MTTETITVQYVNPPEEGKRWGSVKATNRQYYGVAADDMAKFQKGATYEVEYETKEIRGKTYRTIKSARPAQQANGAGSYRGDASPETAERIYVCGIVNAAVHAGIKPEADTLAHITNNARMAWHRTFGVVAGKNPNRTDMDDEIPF